MWVLAIKELQQLDRAFTPKTKLNCIYSSLMLINSTFSLFSSEEGVNSACADDILQIFPYIVLKSKIERIYAHFK